MLAPMMLYVQIHDLNPLGRRPQCRGRRRQLSNQAQSFKPIEEMLVQENLENFNHCRLEDHFSSVILPEAACIGEMSRYMLSNLLCQVRDITVFDIRRFQLADVESKFRLHDSPT